MMTQLPLATYLLEAYFPEHKRTGVRLYEHRPYNVREDIPPEGIDFRRKKPLVTDKSAPRIAPTKPTLGKKLIRGAGILGTIGAVGYGVSQLDCGTGRAQSYGTSAQQRFK